jgi:HNH endonuclease/AP2 domain
MILNICGRDILVDDADVELVIGKEWKINKGGYAVFYEGSKIVFMHHLILPRREGVLTDHINRNRADNRRENLRYCTSAQNARNSGPHHDGKSKYKGVLWNSVKGKWQTAINWKDFRRDLGYFDSEDDAARMYDAAAFDLDPQFAYLNFPDELPRKMNARLFKRRCGEGMTSQYRGVFWNKQSGRWRARMMKDGKIYEAGNTRMSVPLLSHTTR